MYAMRKLGKKGRFANQLLQYAFLRIESRDEYQCPPWIGQTIFGLKDPPVTNGARELTYKFPKHSSYYAPNKDRIREWFTPPKEYKDNLDRSVADMRRGRPMIGIHARRGDYGSFARDSARWCFPTPVQWYKDWLRENSDRWDDAKLFIASDEIDRVTQLFDADQYEFSSFPPETNLYEDFYVLTQCDALLISNSTFGFVASMLNTRASVFMRPRLSEKKLIPYDPWNSPIVFKDEKY